MKKKFQFLVILFTVISLQSSAQDINMIVNKTRAKLAMVNTYEASGKMKTNVAFLKVPVANIKVYFRNPDKLRIKSEKGISFIPKGAVSINMGSVLADNTYMVIDAGAAVIDNIPVRVIKLLPSDENSDVILSTVYIDPVNYVVRRAKTTTKDNGTYELEMTYRKYISYGLPDKIIFSFNTKDYKLPKGMTFDFDDGSGTKEPVKKGSNRKGRAEISFFNYIINKPIPESIFR